MRAVWTAQLSRAGRYDGQLTSTLPIQKPPTYASVRSVAKLSQSGLTGRSGTATRTPDACAENYVAQLPTTLQLGAIYGAAGEGRISAAARVDFAEAAAAVLATGDHAGRTYELGGDDAFTMAGLAAAISAATGTPVEYRNVSQAEYEEILTGAGLPAPMPAILADVDRAVAAGELFIDSGDLSRLIGRPTTMLEAALAAA